jgi:transcriptional regulator with XRE-family HTH domain
MPVTDRPADAGLDDARRLSATLAAELRTARQAAGISQATAARAAGLSPAQWGRLERQEIARPDVLQLCCASRALGLRASLKLYPVGSPVRDRAQLSLLARFEAVLGAPLRMRREAPLPVQGDLRAWDAMVEGDGRPFFVEGETRLSDTQAVARRIALKQRDDPRAGTIILVLTRSDHHLRFLAQHREDMRRLLPLDGPAILRALRAGRRPTGSGIVLL